MNEGIRIFEKEITTRENKYPAFKAGDTISVLCEYEDGSKKQQQIFEGIVIQRRHPNTNGETFTIRKISDGVAVEKIFPLLSPSIKDIKIIKNGIVSRARIFYMRDKKGKDVKIKTKFVKKNTKKEKIKEENKQSIKEFPTGNE